MTGLRRWLVALLAALLLPACSGDEREPVRVAAGFFPLAEVARQVGGDHVTVTDLTPPNTDPHDRRSFSLALQGRADVLLYLGYDFQPELAALAKTFNGGTVDALSGLPVVDDDAHVWLDPTMLATITDAVLQAIGDADPGHRDDYEENAAQFRAQLTSLDRQLTRGLAECDRNIVVSAHSAWRYFTSRVQLEQEPLAGTAGGAPTPERTQALTALVHDAGVTTVFREPQLDDGPITALAAATGAKVATLDPVETRGGGYVERMRRNLTVLRAALGCA